MNANLLVVIILIEFVFLPQTLARRAAYLDADDVRHTSMQACYDKILKMKKGMQISLNDANVIVARFIEEGMRAGVKAFSIQSRVIRVKANQFYECPWNNDNTACCLSSSDPEPKTAGPRGRVYHRIGATLHYGRPLFERPCTTECLWIGENCEAASTQKLSAFMEGTLERTKLTQDIHLQRQFNDSNVNSASSMMSSIEGMAFLTADMLAAGYNVSVHDKGQNLLIEIRLWDKQQVSALTPPEVSKDLTVAGVAHYLEYLSQFIPCKLQ